MRAREIERTEQGLRKRVEMSQIRQNYHEDCEKGVNKQIYLELYAFYTYTSMSHYFERDDMALPGFAKFFCKAASEELQHAQALMSFQNARGGRIVLEDIKKPAKDEWGTGLEAMETALELERMVNQAVLDLHKVADTHGDVHMAHFLDEKLVCEQVEAIKKIGDYVTQLKKVGSGHGEFEFDQETLG